MRVPSPKSTRRGLFATPSFPTGRASKSRLKKENVKWNRKRKRERDRERDSPKNVAGPGRRTGLGVGGGPSREATQGRMSRRAKEGVSLDRGLTRHRTGFYGSDDSRPGPLLLRVVCVDRRSRVSRPAIQRGTDHRCPSVGGCASLNACNRGRAI